MEDLGTVMPSTQRRVEAGFCEGVGELIGRDEDVGDEEVTLSEFGAVEDETEMAVRGEVSFGFSLAEKAAFRFADVVSMLLVEGTCEGGTGGG